VGTVDGSSRELLDDQARQRTVGERLDDVGRAIGARHRWTPPVTRHLVPPVRRAEQLAAVLAGRFGREETGDVASLPDLVPPGTGAGTWPRWPPTGLGPESAEASSPAPGRALPVDVRSRLRDVVGAGADAMRVHDDAAADRLARTHAADAVTVGTDVHVRDGLLHPDDPAGFGLLVHEATHVTGALGTGGSAPADAVSRAAEEDVALARELAVSGAPSPQTRSAQRDARTGDSAGAGVADRWLGHGPAVLGPGARPVGGAGGRGGPIGAGGSDGPAAAPAAAAAAGTAVPMTAAVDRAGSPQAPIDVDALRRDLVSELMHRLRSEFERGA
jgi:hypothetical protein